MRVIVLGLVLLLVGGIVIFTLEELQRRHRPGAEISKPEAPGAASYQAKKLSTRPNGQQDLRLYQLTPLLSNPPWKTLGGSLAVDSKERIYVSSAEGIYRVEGDSASLFLPGSDLSIVGIDPDDNLVLYDRGNCDCFFIKWVNPPGGNQYLRQMGVKPPWRTTNFYIPGNAAVTGRRQLILLDDVELFRIEEGSTTVLTQREELGIPPGYLHMTANFSGEFYAVADDGLYIGSTRTGEIDVKVPREQLPPDTVMYIAPSHSGGAILTFRRSDGPGLCTCDRAGHISCVADAESWETRLKEIEGQTTVVGLIVEGLHGTYFFTSFNRLYRASPREI